VLAARLLVSHNHDRLYILGANVDGRRRGMDNGREEGNDYRKRVFLMRDAQTLDVFIRELLISVCLSHLLPNPFISLR